MHDRDTESTDGSTAHAKLRREGELSTWETARRLVGTADLRGLNSQTALHLQRTVGNGGIGNLVNGEDETAERSPVLDVVGKGGGSPLPAEERAGLESHLGADFGDVRVHDGAAAAESARAVNARAYTVGNEIVFDRGAYQPGTADGQRTLAHELTHVVQQRSGAVDGTPTGDGIALSHPDDRFEREASNRAASLDVAQTTASPAVSSADSASRSVQRDDTEEELPEAQTLPIQRQEAEEEEEVPEAQTLPLQREEMEEEEAAE